MLRSVEIELPVKFSPPFANTFSEGCGRGSDEDFKRFLRNASGSAFEVEYILLLSKDLNYISEEKFIELTPKAEELKIKISKLILKIEEDINKKKNR